MDAKATWHKGLSFTGSVAGSGFTLPLGADPKVGGLNDGFRPLELLAVGLAGCTGMDVISILEKKRQPVMAFEVRVHADLAEEHPHVFTKVLIEYVVTGKGVEREAVEQAAKLSETNYCSVQAMLRKAAPIESKITIVETGA
ncbi:MAG: OsmC family protein [Spirochaetes bacterium]|nr:OsmC family protein [Spirochaetota bacterium]